MFSSSWNLRVWQYYPIYQYHINNNNKEMMYLVEWSIICRILKSVKKYVYSLSQTEIDCCESFLNMEYRLVSSFSNEYKVNDDYRCNITNLISAHTLKHQHGNNRAPRHQLKTAEENLCLQNTNWFTANTNVYNPVYLTIQFSYLPCNESIPNSILFTHISSYNSHSCFCCWILETFKDL